MQITILAVSAMRSGGRMLSSQKYKHSARKGESKISAHRAQGRRTLLLVVSRPLLFAASVCVAARSSCLFEARAHKCNRAEACRAAQLVHCS